MSKLYLMLADMDVSEVLDAHKQYGNSQLTGILITFGALAFVVVIATIWAIRFSLKKKKRKHHKHREHRNHTEAVASRTRAAAETTSAGETKSRKKRHRRSRAPMNPTLAQTGGLPPMRGKNTPPPPMP